MTLTYFKDLCFNSRLLLLQIRILILEMKKKNKIKCCYRSMSGLKKVDNRQKAFNVKTIWFMFRRNYSFGGFSGLKLFLSFFFCTWIINIFTQFVSEDHKQFPICCYSISKGYSAKVWSKAEYDKKLFPYFNRNICFSFLIGKRPFY